MGSLLTSSSMGASGVVRRGSGSSLPINTVLLDVKCCFPMIFLGKQN